MSNLQEKHNINAQDMDNNNFENDNIINNINKQIDFLNDKFGVFNHIQNFSEIIQKSFIIETDKILNNAKLSKNKLEEKYFFYRILK